MNLKLNIGIWNKIFAVPHELVEKHLKLCSAYELKFILWLFANPEREIDKEVIFKETGIPTFAVDDCLEYWLQAGLLKQNENELGINAQAEKPKLNEIAMPAPKDVPMKKMLRPDGIYIAKRLNESPELAHVFEHAEAVFGKMISPSLSAVLIIAHDDYALPCEVIVMLLSYCASIEKTSTNYIETIVKNWYNNNITSLELAEEKIREINSINHSWKKLTQILEMPFRKASKAEEELAVLAIMTYNFSEEMIKLCYDKCIAGTGKFQCKYMRKIFDSWHQKNLKTPKDVELSDSARKTSKEVQKETSYDLNEFHRLNLFNLEEDNDEL